MLGRDFRDDDDRSGADRVAIISASVWRTRYDADPAIIGRLVTIDGAPTTIVGVMRDGFRFPLVHDLWQPLASEPGLAAQPRDARTLTVLALLAKTISLEQGRAELNRIATEMSATYPSTNAGVRAVAQPFLRNGFNIANPWNAMRAAVTIVLLIACANIANLLLTRGAHRTNEIALRTALGASRGRIMRQLFVESAILAGLAGVAGGGLAYAGVKLWLAAMPVADWPYWFHFSVDGKVLRYLIEISVASVLLFGLGPAWQASRSNAGRQITHAARTQMGGSGSRGWTNVLLGAQFALTLALLAGAGLLARTLIAVYRADSIVDASNIVLSGVDLPASKYPTPQQRTAWYGELETRISAIPSVEAASVASGAPFYNAPVWSVEFEGRPVEAAVRPATSYVVIGSAYFDTLGLRMIRGRAFENVDGTLGHEAAIVNQLFATRFLAGVDPIGARVRLTDPRAPTAAAPWLTIVGVSPTVRQHYAQEIDAVAYVPYRSDPVSGMTLLTRARSDAASLAPAMREQLRQLDRDLPLLDIRPLTWLISGTQFANRVAATLFGLAGVLGLFLAALGLYAITSYAIRQRTQEIGIRIALGAESRHVVWLFVRRVLTPLAVGTVLGLIGAFGVGQVVRSMLIGTSPQDPLTLVAVAIILIAVAMIAAVGPARRATRIDPAAALRSE
jgi:putative ABC transport system permease protein